MCSIFTIWCIQTQSGGKLPIFMKVIADIIILFLLIVSASYPLKAQDEKQVLLSEIAARIDQYKGKRLTMKLKLKMHDTIFEKIVFYDSKNHDIEFDISDRPLKKKLAPEMKNLHEGLVYLVTFTVRDAGNQGQIIGDLEGFTPVVIGKLPENGGG